MPPESNLVRGILTLILADAFGNPAISIDSFGEAEGAVLAMLMAIKLDCSPRQYQSCQPPNPSQLLDDVIAAWNKKFQGRPLTVGEQCFLSDQVERIRTDAHRILQSQLV